MSLLKMDVNYMHYTILVYKNIILYIFGSYYVEYLSHIIHRQTLKNMKFCHNFYNLYFLDGIHYSTYLFYAMHMHIVLINCNLIYEFSEMWF